MRALEKAFIRTTKCINFISELIININVIES